MVKLFIYGASEIDKKSPTYHIDKYDEVLDGFREALKELDPPSPFLIRGLFGDYEYKENPHRIIALNTFDKKNLSQLILDILQHGHDRTDNRKGLDYFNEEEFFNRTGIKYCDMIWACKYYYIGKAFPYRIGEDNGDFPQGFINDLSIVMDANFYKPTDEHSIFYQPDIELRKKALLGIIISDVNSKMSKRKPLKFDLTEQNLDEVIKKIQEKDFF